MIRGRARSVLLVGIVSLPVLSLATGSVMLVPLFAIPGLFIVSGLLFGARRRPPGQADDDGGDGGSGPPFDPPDPPLGGPPLPDAEPSRGRLRDHDRPARTWRARRRDRAHPVRTPVRTIQNA